MTEKLVKSDFLRRTSVTVLHDLDEMILSPLQQLVQHTIHSKIPGLRLVTSYGDADDVLLSITSKTP